MAAIARLVAVAGAAAILAACAGTVLETVGGREPTGSAFTQELYAGYVGLARSEYDEADYRDSDEFSRRAIAAGQGSAVDPEPIADRALPENRLRVLAASRARLVAALEAGGRDKAPGDAAAAQIGFDCWMQEQEENHQPDDIAACQTRFTDAIARLEAAVAPPPAPEPEPQMAMPEPRSFTVLFAFDSAQLDDAAKAVLGQVAAAARDMPGARIAIGGHADTAGTVDYNDRLSRERAEGVAGHLVATGLDGDAMSVSAYGQSRPAVDTGDGVRNSRNRRVEIVVAAP